MNNTKLLNSRKIFNLFKANSNRTFYKEIKKFSSSKNEDKFEELRNMPSGDKPEIKFSAEEATKTFSKFQKVYGNMTGMDKIEAYSLPLNYEHVNYEHVNKDIEKRSDF